MRPLAIAILVGIPVILGLSMEGAPDDPACPEVAGWFVGLLCAWGLAVAALAILTLVATRRSAASA